jgi:hypothetical protein
MDQTPVLPAWQCQVADAALITVCVLMDMSFLVALYRAFPQPHPPIAKSARTILPYQPTIRQYSTII